MGQITDTLRATLRELAQSDARLYRGLEQELRDVPPEPEASPMLIEAAAEASACADDLELLSNAKLWDLCKNRGIRGLSKAPKDQLVDALLNHPDGPPPLSTLPAKASRGGKAAGALAARGKASGADLQQLEQRLDRLEQLLVLIARQVGVPAQALALWLGTAGSAAP